MRTVLKYLLITGALVGTIWVTVSVRIEGRTPYGHFRHFGGEKAVLTGWAWTKKNTSKGSSTAWDWTKQAASFSADKVSGWASAAYSGAQTKWAEWRAEDKPEAPVPQRKRRKKTAPKKVVTKAQAAPPAKGSVGKEEPEVQTGGSAKARVALLKAAEKKVNESTSHRLGRSTQIDRRISKDEALALDRLLSKRQAH